MNAMLTTGWNDPPGLNGGGEIGGAAGGGDGNGGGGGGGEGGGAEEATSLASAGDLYWICTPSVVLRDEVCVLVIKLAACCAACAFANTARTKMMRVTPSIAKGGAESHGLWLPPVEPERGPQSKQSEPREHMENSLPGPPSSQSLSLAAEHVLVQPPLD